MSFQPSDRVTITNPHPENAKYRGKTGTVREIDSGGYLLLEGVDGRLREKLLGYVACEPNELKAA